jgi:hypothetical protein
VAALLAGYETAVDKLGQATLDGRFGFPEVFGQPLPSWPTVVLLPGVSEEEDIESKRAVAQALIECQNVIDLRPTLLFDGITECDLSVLLGHSDLLRD